MRDFFSPEERSKLMSRIRGRANISTELKIAGILRASGVRGWRRHLSLPGRPDFTFSKQRICIFVHGCFWHDCPRCRKRSSTRPEYWAKKIEVNRKRDQRVSRELRHRGYKVIVVWECTLRRKHPTGTVRKLLRLLNKSGVTPANRHHDLKPEKRAGRAFLK
jgi:DNA mismatch endonuclease (patch repair protein)